MFGMLSHRRCGVARSFMLPYPGSESALRFTNIGCRTLLAVELVNNTRFVHSIDFILGGHKLLPDGVNWLVMGADALTLIDSGNSLRDTFDVGDYHTSFRGGLLAYFAFCLSVFLLLLTAKTHGSWPHLGKQFWMWCISCCLSSSRVMIVLARWVRVLTTISLCCRGWCELNLNIGPCG